MRITHYGHSCLLVEEEGSRLLIDPGAFSHGFEELTGLDAVLVTHQHLDHLDVERLPPLLEANDGAALLVEPETAAELHRAGIDAKAFHVGETATFGAFEVGAIGGRHAVIHEDVPRIGNVGLVVRSAGGTTLYHPGDMLEETPAGVDVLAVPVAAPWSALKDTVEFARAVRARTLLPVHDALLSPVGRGVFLRVLGSLLPEGSTLKDVAAEPVEA